MKGSRAVSTPSGPPEGNPEGVDLSLTGLPPPLFRRPNSASAAKPIARSVSVVAGSEPRRKALEAAGPGGSRAINNLRRSNSATQVHQPQASPAWAGPLRPAEPPDFLTLFESSPGGRRRPASLSRACSEKGATWHVLDDQPRAFTLPPSARGPSTVDTAESPGRRGSTVAPAPSFTANNRSNKGAVGNCVTTMVHNRYAPVDTAPPKSSNHTAPSLNNLIKAATGDGEGGGLGKTQKNLAGSTHVARNSSGAAMGLLRRREVTEEEAERFIHQVNQAAITIQRWYRRQAQRRRAGAASLQCLLASKREGQRQRLGEGSPLDLHRQKEAARRKAREEKARQARQAAIQELQQKRAQKSGNAELGMLKGAREPGEPRPAQEPPLRPGGTAPQTCKANDAGAGLRTTGPDAPSQPAPSSSPEPQQFSEDKLQDAGSQDAADEAPGTAGPAGGRAKSRATLDELLDTLKLLEEEPEPLPRPRAYRKDRYAWTDEVAVGALPHPSPGARRCSPQGQGSVVGTRWGLVGLLPAPPPNFSWLTEAWGRCFRIAWGWARLCQWCPQVVPCEGLGIQGPFFKTRPSCPPFPWGSLRGSCKATPESLAAQQSQCCGPSSQEDDASSLTADNLEKFGKLSAPTGPAEDGALLSEAKLQSILSFLNEMERSGQDRPASVPQGLAPEEGPGCLESVSEVSTSVMRLKLEVEEKKQAMALLQRALAQQRDLTVRRVKETEKELGRQLQQQREHYEATIQRHLSFIDQLIEDKKTLGEKCQAVVAELKQGDQRHKEREAQMQDQHQLEIKKLKELMSATEKVRREKWISEKTRKIKEITVRGLEPEIQKLIAKHKQEVKRLRSLHAAELQQAEERAAQRYGRQAEALREQLEREKEALGQQERERAQQRFEQQLEQEQRALQQLRQRLHREVAEEKERLDQQAARQRGELEELRQQLEDSSSAGGRALRAEFEKGREEQERRHQMELQALKDQLEVERQMWEANRAKKEEAWLLNRERELKEEIRRGRDKEIELVIHRLEADMTLAREESERAAESRVKRIRDKYEVELSELEQSERKLQGRCTELKGRLAEADGERVRLQGLLRHKDKELADAQAVNEQLAGERGSLAQVLRQEFADRLAASEEENRQVKAELAALRARQQLELEQLTREKQAELEEVHGRVKKALAKKEEAVSSLRRQHEAAMKRADHLEELLDQRRRPFPSTK
ncbi:centrosomal protein of 131 kDa isoform X1 [Rousettus aegyptiacus]|nr:centrosomal protein of 131 kDa isoform X1 [Rousettus aegyptiacus]